MNDYENRFTSIYINLHMYNDYIKDHNNVILMAHTYVRTSD